jgi:hypothetical protein
LGVAVLRELPDVKQSIAQTLVDIFTGAGGDAKV